MAVESKIITLDAAWRLISASNADGLRIRSPSGYPALVHIADALPAASVEGRPVTDELLSALGSGKVYARAVSQTVRIEIVRTIDAGNPPIATLQELSLSSSTFTAGATAGTEIGSIVGRTAGSALMLERETFDIVIDSASGKLLTGLVPAGPGDYKNAIIETLPGSSNSPRRTAFTYSVAPIAGGGTTAWIADNRGASISEQGVQGGGNTSLIGSRPRSLPFDLQRFYVVVPVFFPKLATAPTITDTLFADLRTFAFALAPWQASPANRPAGVGATFGGSPSATYDPATWDPNAPLIQGGGVAMVSNLVDLGASAVPANTVFDWRSAVKAAAGLLPYTGTVNGTDQTGHATVVSTGDIVTAGVAGARTFAAIPTTDVSWWDNSIIVAEGPNGQRRVFSIGDSKLYAMAYDKGDIEGHGGVINRGLKAKGSANLNLGRGADGAFNLQTAANWAMRRRLTQVVQALGATFTGGIQENVHNDVTKSETTPSLARSTAYKKWDFVNAPSIGLLVCTGVTSGTDTGTTAATTLSVGAGVNRAIQDGTVTWARISTSNGGGPQAALAVVARIMAVNDQLRSLLPGVPFYGWAAEPGTTTQTSQTPIAGFGGSTSKRGLINAFLRDTSLNDLFGHVAVIDTNPVLELSYPPTETSTWADTNDCTDGTHHAKAGAIKGAPIVAAVGGL